MVVGGSRITVKVGRRSRGNRFWFELARSSSYRESTVSVVEPKKTTIKNSLFTNLIIRLLGRLSSD